MVAKLLAIFNSIELLRYEHIIQQISCIFVIA